MTKPEKEHEADRLARRGDALRENLKRRKSQARGRASAAYERDAPAVPDAERAPSDRSPSKEPDDAGSN